MPPIKSCIAAGIVLAAAFGAHPLAADARGRGHALHRIDPRAAETWAWELCEQLARRRACEVQRADEDELVVFAPDDVHAAVVRMLAARDPATRPARTFHVALLAATAGTPGVDGALAEAARAALDDVRAYLPFDRFAVLGTGSARTAEQGTVRIAGSDGAVYEIAVSYERAVARLDGLDLSLRVAARQVVDPPRLLLDSRLGVTDGETVVLGHVQPAPSGPALIAILTVRP